MIKHIVMWRLKDKVYGNNRATNARPDTSSDIVLYPELESRDACQAHPEHRTMMPFVQEARAECRVVDYDL